jgi:hypothetical protein
MTSAIFLLILFNEHMLMILQNDPPFGALQFTVDEVQSVLLELDVSKGAGSDAIPMPYRCHTASYSEELCNRFCALTFSSF